MKVAIHIIGNVRTWDKCQHEFQKAFGNTNADLFVSTYDAKHGYHPHNQGLMRDSGEEYYTDPNEIIELFKPYNLKSIVIDKFEDFDAKTSNFDFDARFKHLHGNCFNPMYKLKHSLEMMTQYEKQNGFEYDVVIKTRSDIMYFDNIDLSFNKGQIVIDSANVFPNDWIFVTDRDTMINISNFLVNEFFNPIYPDSEQQPPHKFYLNAMNHFGLDIQKRDIAQFLLRKNGETWPYR
jgi:hypothetical protein